MYCSTCGTRVPDGHSRCDACGSPVSRPAGFGVPAVAYARPGVPTAVATCPRCGFQGPTVGYFSQGGPVAGLLLLSLLTLPFMGAGGILYYLLRHNHRACARCGETLGRGETLALAASAAGGAPLPAAAAAEADLPAEGGGRGWTVGAMMLFAFAAFMLMIVGLAEGEFVGFVFSALATAGGAGMLKLRNRAREERRAALITAMQQPVLRLAGERGGRLTVTDVASSLNWPMRRAEKVLNSLEDGLRVVSDVTNDGVIVYDFRELMHAPRSVSGEEMDLLLNAAPQRFPDATQAQPYPQGQPVAQQAPPQQSQSAPHPRDGTLRA